MTLQENTRPAVDPSPLTSQMRQVRLLRESGVKLPAPRTLEREEWPPDYDSVNAWRKAQLASMEQDPSLIAGAKVYYSTRLIEFINHWCDTYDPRNVGTTRPVWMPFIMFKRQEELAQFVVACMMEEESGLVEKCRTMGATWVCVAVSVWLWLFHPSVAIGWGSQDAVSVDRIGDSKSIFWKLRELIGRVPKIFLPEGLADEHLKQYVCYNPQTLASIVGEVGDKIGRGGRTRVYFKDESAHYLHPELIEASLSENTKTAIDISSVNGPGNLFYRKRKAGIDWELGKVIEKGYTRIFVMDSYDHPEYDKKWHDDKRQFHERQGTLHVYAQEITRDYTSAVQGTIIPKEWVDACIDAHVKLGIAVEGSTLSALDIGDSTDGDRNAQSVRTGIVLTYMEEWSARDPGVTARKAIALCVDHKVPELQYDCVGIGSNVKSEANRLKDEGAFPEHLRLVPWNAGAKVLHAAHRVVPNDSESPRNKDFYMNLKAQAWWQMRERIYKTFQAVSGKGEYDPDELFSIDSKLTLRHKIVEELCQATASKGSRLKLVVDKTPEGTRSPNLADAVVMAYWPIPFNTGDFVDVGFGGKVYVGGVQIIT